MRKIIPYLIFISMLCLNILNAQQKIVLSKSFQKDYHISNYETVTTNLSIDSFMILNRDVFKLGTHDDIVVDYSDTDKYGWEHKKYNIFHKGIKVEKQNINVQKNGNELIYLGRFVEKLDLDTTNLIDIAIIKDSLSKKMGYSVTSNNSQYRKAIINRYLDVDNKVSTMRIIYVVEVQGLGQFSSTKIFNIDAQNGEILYEYKDECNTLVSCPTVHYGNRMLQTKPQNYVNALNTNICSSNFFIDDNFVTNGTTAPNFNIDDTLNQKRIFGVTNGLNSDQDWVFGEANRLSNDALRASIQRTLNEAQYLTRNSLDMFKSKFDESNNLLGEFALSKLCLVNGAEVPAYQNSRAFVIGVPVSTDPFKTFIKEEKYMEIGRCATFFMQNNMRMFNFTNEYMVGTDIIAHEITHNLVNKYAKLNMMLESGALAESYCDIFGYYLESWMNRNNLSLKAPNWTVGDEVNISTYNSIFRNNPNPLAINARSMNQPEIYTDPAFYNGTFYKNPNCCLPNDTNDMCWIHSHNSINNRWFFLCVNGMINDSNPPIHIDTLMNVVYDNLKYNLSPNATLMQARRGSLISLKKIYGNHPAYNTMKNLIRNAWDSVAVYDNDHLIFTLNTMPGENRIGNGTYFVYNDIIIPTGHHVRIENATLYFDENRKIKTEIGGCLYVKNSKLTSMNFGCFTFSNPFYWRGIEMEGYSDGYKNYNLFLNNFNNGFDNVGTTQKDFRTNSSLILGLNIYNSEISYADTAVKSGKYVFFDDAIPSNATLAGKKQTGCDINIYMGNFFNNKKDIFYVLDNDRPTFVRVYNTKFHVDNGMFQRDYLKGSKIEIRADVHILNQNSIKDYSKQSINDWYLEIYSNNQARINFQFDTFKFPSYEGELISNPFDPKPYNLNKVISTKLSGKYRTFGQFQSLAIEGCVFTGSRQGIEAINTPSIRILSSKFDSVDFPIYASGYKNISVKNDSFSNSYIPVKLNNYNELSMSRDKQDSMFFYSDIINNKFYYSGFREVEALATRNIQVNSNVIVNRYNRLIQDLAKNFQREASVSEGVKTIKEYTAINLQHCKKSTISNNSFSNEGSHPLVWFFFNSVKLRMDTMPLYYTAMAITNNSNTNDFIYKNTIKDGWDIGVNSYGLNTGLRIKCNAFGTSNNPFNIAAIYTKGNLRWQGCTDAFIQNPTANFPCNNENTPAANTFSWNTCTMPDEAKLYLDTTATVSFQYFTQSVDGGLAPTPFVDNRASSYCLNTPRNIPRTSVNNCGSGTNGYKIMPNTCNETNILQGKLISYTDNENGGKVPICTNWDRLYVDKSVLLSQLNELRLNNAFKTGLEHISKDMVVYNLKNEIAATDFELFNHAERCRDTLKLDTLNVNANSLNIKLDRLQEQILSKNNSTAESIATLQGQIQADNELPTKIKSFYAQELAQYSTLNNINKGGSMDATVWSPLINTAETEAQVIARQIYAEKKDIILPCLLPTIDMTENDIRMQYLTDNLSVNNNYVFEMYPNPVSDILEYRCQLNPEILNAKVTLFNVSYPASYLVDRTIEARGSISENIEVSAYAQGNYILTLWINGVPKKSYMVIKQ